MTVRTLLPAVLLGTLVACESPEITNPSTDPGNGNQGQADVATTTVTGKLVFDDNSNLVVEVSRGKWFGHQFEIVGARVEEMHELFGSNVMVVGSLSGDQIEVVSYTVVFDDRP